MKKKIISIFTALLWMVICTMLNAQTAFAAGEAGISIPEDLSILSFNNSLFARLTSPQLTSIDINSGQLGMEAASQMISHIENPNLPATKIIVPHHLIERDSCRRI